MYSRRSGSSAPTSRTRDPGPGRPARSESTSQRAAGGASAVSRRSGATGCIETARRRPVVARLGELERGSQRGQAWWQRHGRGAGGAEGRRSIRVIWTVAVVGSSLPSGILRITRPRSTTGRRCSTRSPRSTGLKAAGPGDHRQPHLDDARQVPGYTELQVERGRLLAEPRESAPAASASPTSPPSATRMASTGGTSLALARPTAAPRQLVD